MPIIRTEEFGELSVHITGAGPEHDETRTLVLVDVAEGTTLIEFVIYAVGLLGWMLPSREWTNAAIKQRPSLCDGRGVCALLSDTFEFVEGDPIFQALVWLPGTVSEAPAGAVLQSDLRYLVTKSW